VPLKLQWTLPSHLQKSVVNTLTGGPRENKDSEAKHVNDGSTPLDIITGALSVFTMDLLP